MQDINIKTQKIKFNKPLKLISGRELQAFELITETYGKLNENKNNAILICHALSGDHHAAGFYEQDKKPGWWNNYIGSNKPIDTNKFFVVCVNNIGGCSGSSGPRSVNPETGDAYGASFPMVTVTDWINTQYLLMQHLLIDKWAAIIGGSLGGMQAMQWSITYPDKLQHCIIIASAPYLSTQNIAFNELARQAIISDPDYMNGDFAKFDTTPKRGLKLARMTGHITYLSDDDMREKFGRDKLADLTYDLHAAQFQIESYLRYQGERFSHKFDANTYLLMTKALDYFDPAHEHNGDLALTFQNAQAQFLVISFATDWRFSPKRSQEIVNALIKSKKSVTYVNIDAPNGHDAFLLPSSRYEQSLKTYLDKIYSSL